MDGPMLNEKLVYTFFSTFARLEYALKRSGFAREARHGGAEPAWDDFVDSIESRWTDCKDPAFPIACEFLLRSPPGQQVLRDNVLDWKDTVRKADETEASFVIRCVKRIRNNLFHGGKFPIPTGPVDAPERDQQLLEHGLSILSAVVQMNEGVRDRFAEHA